MCGGCNIYAEGAGASLIFARYWWVARQGRKAVAEAESLLGDVPAAEPAADPTVVEPANVTVEAAHRPAFVDPLDDVVRISVP